MLLDDDQNFQTLSGGIHDPDQPATIFEPAAGAQARPFKA
jgi:hypothetical protein